MKIVFVATYIPDTNYTRDLSVYFDKILKKGDKLYLCGPKNDRVLDNKKPKVNYVWRRGWKFFFDVLAYVKKKDPDVVHLQHEFKTYGGLISALLFPPLLLILRLLQYPVVVTIHGVVSPQQVDYQFLENFNVKPDKLRKFFVLGFFHYVYRSILLFSNKVTVHAPMLKEVFEKYYGACDGRVEVIDHGIREIKSRKHAKNLGIFKKFPLTENKHLIIIFGHFSPRKGYELLIEEFTKITNKKKYDNWMLVLVGDVQKEFFKYKRKIERLIKNNKLQKRILITGFVGARELDEFFRYAKIVTIPAIISFNTSGALSLALAYKKPMLVANVKPLADEVSRNNFGLLYTIGGKKALNIQLRELIENKKKYNSLVANLNRVVKKRYWTKIAKNHYELYDKLLK